VLLSIPLHASSNFTVSIQLANKRELKKIIKKLESTKYTLTMIRIVIFMTERAITGIE
jgi:hypothetical protein